MAKKVIVTPILEDSASIWLYLKHQGGLDTKSYDEGLEQDIRSHLSLPDKGRLEDLLRSTATSVETFLFAFFKTIQPYAEMTSDLLRMFEEAGATQSNSNLAVRFDFGTELPELSFDLAHFRQWNEVWSRVAGVFLVNVWDYQTIWELNGALRTMRPQVAHPTAKQWVTEYGEFRVWPKLQLQAPRAGEKQLDDVLQRAWWVWMTVVAESARYGDSRDDLRRQRNRPNEQGEFAKLSENNRRRWSPEFLASIDSDGWAGSFASGAYDRAECISTLPPAEKRAAAEELKSALERVFDQVRQEEMQGEALLQSLQDFLQLPVWRRRHELYSTWVGSQIIDACEDYGVRIHQVDGALLLSFAGTHLATLTRGEPTMHIWAELRSPLGHPIGKGRKRSIQPDYSVIGDPITAPELSILEIECKQYKTASAKNFCDALTDYATGRPRAHVVLVNYGHAKESLLDGVDPSLRGRTSLVGLMRPGSSEAQSRFRDIVSKVLSERCVKLGSPSVQPVSLPHGMTARLTLSWEAVPRDLDLHVRILSPEQDWEVYFSNRGSTTQAPWVQLDSDIQSGCGPETVDIAQWVKGGKYHIAVHNYSNDRVLALCGASLVFTQGPLIWKLECPQAGTGRWWSILVLDSDSGEVQVINKIVDQPW